MAELPARIGMRVGELVNLEADAVVQIGANHWLRIPNLDHSLATFAGHTAYNTDKLRADLHRLYSYSGISDREQAISANPVVINNSDPTRPPLDRITRITPTGCDSASKYLRAICAESGASASGSCTETLQRFPSARLC